MPNSFSSSDRKLVIVCACLLVLITAAGMLFVRPPKAPALGFPSSYSASSGGAKAAYLLLEKLGYREERWTQPPEALPMQASHVVLILADPFLQPSSEEKAGLVSFLRRGGRVLATGSSGAALLSQKGIGFASPLDFDWHEFPARLPGPISRRAPNISMRSQARWRTVRPQDLDYYRDAQGGTVVSFRLGLGKVVWWASASPLTNAGLKQASNLELFLNSVGEAKGARVLWDEYYHGERRGFWSYLGSTPVPWMLLQLGLVFLAAVFTFSRRSGPVMAAETPSRLSPLEFVETVGDLYARKRAAHAAFEIAYHRFRSLLTQRLGIAPAPAGGLAPGTKRERMREIGVLPVLSECEAALRQENLGEGQTLELVQNLHEQTRRLRLVGLGE